MAGILLAASAALLVVLLDDVVARIAIVAAVVALVLWVIDQERRLTRLTQGLVEERVLSSQLTERVRDLSTLSRVGQAVNSNLTTDEVLQAILRGARELTGAVKGSVMLVERGSEELVVAAARR